MEALLMKTLTAYMDKDIPVALVTVTSKTGSGPRDSGSMMLVDQEGQLLAGTIGGGKVEEQAKTDAITCIKTQVSSAFHYELTLKKTDHALGMACGGTVDVFIKVFAQRDLLVIFGGGHIGLDLCHFAKVLNYHVTIIDHRPDYVSEERFPLADQRMLMSAYLASPLGLDDKTSVVIVTHGHAYDMEALRSVCESPARYIGMIGSKNKIQYCFKTLTEEGVAPEALKRVHAPIGLNIGGETPAEIALAILAEMQAVKYQKSGEFLKL